MQTESRNNKFESRQVDVYLFTSYNVIHTQDMKIGQQSSSLSMAGAHAFRKICSRANEQIGKLPHSIAVNPSIFIHRFISWRTAFSSDRN